MEKRIIKKARESEETVTISVDGAFQQNRREVSADYSKLAISADINTLISGIRRQVQDDLEDREREVQQRVEDAYREGYNKGLEDGAQKERNDRLKSIDSLFREAKSKSENAIRRLEVKVVDLAVVIAEKLVRKSLHADPHAVEEMAAEIMSHIIGSESVVLKVSADDYQVINARYNTWLSMAGSASEFKIEIDKRMRTGDFLIETEGGLINGIIEDRINVLIDELLKVSE